jgi:NitT/TauT family transport system substrate-binding protein
MSPRQSKRSGPSGGQAKAVARLAILLLFAVAAAPLAARADTVKLAVPIKGSWGTSYVQLGTEQGFFKEQGIEPDITWTEGGASNEQAIISGSVDIGVATGYLGIISAYVKGAPVRIVSAEATGAPDMFWYAKATSGIKSLKDLHGKTVAFSNPGSSSNLILMTLLKEAGMDDVKLVAIGAAPNGLPQVMTGQLDASWCVPPTGLRELAAKDIVIVARGNDSAAVRNETVRVNAVNLNYLQQHRDTVVRFMRGYAKSVEWMYSGEAPIAAFAKIADMPVELVRQMVKEFQSKKQDQVYEIKGTPRVLEEALAAKRIPKPMTPDDIKGVYDIVLNQPKT